MILEASYDPNVVADPVCNDSAARLLPLPLRARLGAACPVRVRRARLARAFAPARGHHAIVNRRRGTDAAGRAYDHP